MTADWEDMIARCEPLYATDGKTYMDAVKEAASATIDKLRRDQKPAGIPTMEYLTGVMQAAIGIRNAYYCARVNEWRVVHG